LIVLAGQQLLVLGHAAVAQVRKTAGDQTGRFTAGVGVDYLDAFHVTMPVCHLGGYRVTRGGRSGLKDLCQLDDEISTVTSSTFCYRLMWKLLCRSSGYNVLLDAVCRRICH